MERRYKIFLLVMLGMFAAFASLINNTLGPVLKLVAATFQGWDSRPAWQAWRLAKSS